MEGNPHENLESVDPKLLVFRQEIRDLKQREAEKTGESRTAHFTRLDPEKLTIKDMDMWEAIKSIQFNLDMLKPYTVYLRQTSEEELVDSKLFLGYLNNILASSLYDKESKLREQSLEQPLIAPEENLG